MERYKVEVNKDVYKQIRRLPQRDIKAILDRIGSLAENPRPIDCKKLSAREDYRIRYGNYRILYRIQDNILLVCVVKVGHRRDVYR